MTFLFGQSKNKLGFITTTTKDSSTGPRHAVMRLLHQFLLQFTTVDPRRSRSTTILQLTVSSTITVQKRLKK